MANETRRISPTILQDDKDALSALKNMSGYAPSNKDYALTKIQAAFDGMDSAQETETQKAAEAATSRDDATAAEWNFHNAILGAKKQVVAQYGEDSNEIQSLGLVKKSEISRAGGRKAKPESKV